MVEIALFTLAAAALVYILITAMIFDAVAPRERIIAELRARLAVYEAERAEQSLFRRPARVAA